MPVIRCLFLVLALGCCLPHSGNAQESARTQEIRKSVTTASGLVNDAKKAVTTAEKKSADAVLAVKKLEAQLKAAQTAVTNAAKAVTRDQAKLKTADAEFKKQKQRLQNSETADKLSAVAAEAIKKQQAMEKSLADLKMQLAKLELDSARFVSEAAQAKRAADGVKAKLKPQEQDVTKATAAYKAAEAATQEPKTKIAAAKTALNKAQADYKALQKKSMDSAQVVVSINKALAALKESAAAARKAADLSKGTTAEKATTESVNVQNDAVQKTTAIAATLAKRAKDVKAKADAAAAGIKPLQEAVGKAEKEAEPKLKAASAAMTALKAAEEILAKSKAMLTAAEQKMAKANEQKTSLGKKIETLRPVISKTETQLAALQADAVKKQKAVEEQLKTLDAFVSFSNRIAPIFAARCVSCHNARIAKGRFNMESFATIMKGSESGSVIEVGDADSSTLFALVEDGSMPPESDSLSPDELAIVKHWINTGANLNAGIADTAALTQIMPRPVQPVPPEKYPTSIPVTALAWSPDGQMLVTSGYHEVLFWDAKTGALKRRIADLPERIYDLSFSPSGEFIAVGSGTPARLGEVAIFRTDNGQRVLNPVRSEDAIHAVAWNSNGTQIAAAGADRAVRVFDAKSGALRLTIEDHADWVMDVAWSPDGKKLASASRDKTAKIFDAATGDSLATFNSHGQPVNCIRFLSTSDQVVSGGLDKQLRIWKVADGKEVRKIGGFGGDVLRLQITKDNHVISASADKFTRIHNTADGKELKKFAGHTDWVYSVSANQNQLASSSLNGEVRTWNLQDGKASLMFVAAPGLVAAE